MRTWCTSASECSPNSCRSSATIETSLTLSRTASASSSISAGVASRPANTPKLTRISSPGGSKVLVARAITGCSGDPTARDSFPPGSKLILARSPAKRAQGEDHAGEPPGGHDRDVRLPVPDLLAAHGDGGDQLDEVRQRQ